MLELLIILFLFWCVINKEYWKMSNTLSCGLLGYSGSKPANSHIIKMLFWDNEDRGTHSSGIGSQIFKTKTGVNIFKSTDRGSKFISDPEACELMKGYNIVGHTRFATMGAHSAENSHPYRFGDIVGTHNGWLLEYSRSPTTIDQKSFTKMVDSLGYDKSKLPVDSMLIYKHMSETNSIKSIEDIEGAMALAFVVGGKLNLYRRESKPLYICKVKDGVYYSSRRESFEKVFGEEYTKSHCELIDENVVFSFRNGVLIDRTEIEPPEIEIKRDELPGTFYSRVRIGKNTPNHTNYTLSSRSTFGYKYMMEFPNELKEISKVASHRIDNPLHENSLLNIFNHPTYNGRMLKCLGYKINKANLSISDKNSVNPSDNQGIITVRVSNDDKENSPLEGFKVMINGQPDSFMSSTNQYGLCAIRVPSLQLKSKKIQLLIHPPSNFSLKDDKGDDLYVRSFYTATLKGNLDGQVMEVACRIPFQSEEEKKEGKDGRSYSGFDKLEKAISDTTTCTQVACRRDVQQFKDIDSSDKKKKSILSEPLHLRSTLKLEDSMRNLSDVEREEIASSFFDDPLDRELKGLGIKVSDNFKSSVMFIVPDFLSMDTREYLKLVNLKNTLKQVFFHMDGCCGVMESGSVVTDKEIETGMSLLEDMINYDEDNNFNLYFISELRSEVLEASTKVENKIISLNDAQIKLMRDVRDMSSDIIDEIEAILAKYDDSDNECINEYECN